MIKKEMVVEVKNLSYSYPDSTMALRNINFSVFKGETCAIVGPNGAGKTTLLLQLNGILRGEGRIKIFGQEITKKNLREIRSKIGIVFQDPNDQLFMPSVFDDIAFGPLNAGLDEMDIRRKIQRILRELKLEGYEGKAPFDLSLGEMKKVSLAGVLILEPEILILDEPTSSLDPGTKRSFLHILNKIRKTKIIATHDLDLVYQLCSRTILLDKGEIIAEGCTLDILRNKELLEAHNLAVPLSLRLEEAEKRISQSRA